MKADIWTYADLITHALDYLGAATDAQTERFARRAIQLAYQTMQSQQNWTYYYQLGHFNTVAPYSTGTVAYTHSTRTVALTGGTWPTWAADGMIVIDNVPYPVVSRTSGSAVVLADANNPGANVAGGTTYEIFREAYTLPVDFGSMDSLYRMNGSPFSLSYLTPGDFLGNMAFNVGPSEPFYYTITNDPNRYGVLAIRLRPAPSDIFPLSFMYRRRPRSLKVDSYNTGTATVTSASTTLTGIGTSWASNLVGCIVRFAQDNRAVPTGPSGANPCWLERSITAFTSATTMTLDAVPGQNLTAVKYSISDPADMEAGAMSTYLLREVERQCRAVKRMKPASDEETQQYQIALRQAFEADSRRFESRSAGAGLVWGEVPLKYGRVLSDVS